MAKTFKDYLVENTIPYELKKVIKSLQDSGLTVFVRNDSIGIEKDNGEDVDVYISDIVNAVRYHGTEAGIKLVQDKVYPPIEHEFDTSLVVNEPDEGLADKLADALVDKVSDGLPEKAAAEEDATSDITDETEDECCEDDLDDDLENLEEGTYKDLAIDVQELADAIKQLPVGSAKRKTLEAKLEKLLKNDPSAKMSDYIKIEEGAMKELQMTIDGNQDLQDMIATIKKMPKGTQNRTALTKSLVKMLDDEGIDNPEDAATIILKESTGSDKKIESKDKLFRDLKKTIQPLKEKAKSTSDAMNKLFQETEYVTIKDRNSTIKAIDTAIEALEKLIKQEGY